MYRSVNLLDEPASPKKLEYLESRKLSETGLSRGLSFDKSISNFEAIFEEMENEEPVTFDK